MRIVFPDGAACMRDPAELSPLRKLGPVDYYDGPPPDKVTLIDRLRPAEAVVLDYSEMDAEVLRACERLRVSFSRFAGGVGFRSVLTRALTLAQRDVPWLAAVSVTAEGALAGFAEGAQAQDPAAAAAGGSAILAQFLGLLHTFVGDALTRRLLADGWPDAPFDPPPSRQENP